MYGEHLEITTQVIMRTLGCSRQYVSELVKRGKLIPSGKRGRSYIFRFSELGKVLDTEKYLKLVMQIDDVLASNMPELFRKKRPFWWEKR